MNGVERTVTVDIDPVEAEGNDESPYCIEQFEVEAYRCRRADDDAIEEFTEDCSVTLVFCGQS